MPKENQAPPAPPVTSADPPAVSDGKATPEEHARATGNVTQLTQEQAVRFGGGNAALKAEIFSGIHKAAAQLHGWNAHEHHEAEPIRLTREDYEKALKAASDPVTRVVTTDKSGKQEIGEAMSEAEVKALNGRKPTRSDYEPHPAACSKHAHGAPKAAKEPSR